MPGLKLIHVSKRAPGGYFNTEKLEIPIITINIHLYNGNACPLKKCFYIEMAPDFPRPTDAL